MRAGSGVLGVGTLAGRLGEAMCAGWVLRQGTTQAASRFFRAVKDPKVVFLLTVIAALLATPFTGHPMVPVCPIGARTQQMESRWIQEWGWRQQQLPLHPHRRPPSCLGQHPLAVAVVLA